MPPKEIVDAAVAVLLRDDNKVLLGQRPEGKSWAGFWEFPGGKIEEGEAAAEALQRELHEELGISATEAYPWLIRRFDYPERSVKLHFFVVRRWAGEPYGKEGQALSWQSPADLTLGPMLPANRPILDALVLPPIYAITNLDETGEAVFWKKLKEALEGGLRLIQVREKHLDTSQLQAFTARVILAAKPYGAKVLLNADIESARDLNVAGVHLNSSQLMSLQAKPEGLLCGASCHNAAELKQAANLGLDFVVLSSVMATRSHPETLPLGWRKFNGLIQNYPLPVYALGGLSPQDLVLAWQNGAHGIAMQRNVW